MTFKSCYNFSKSNWKQPTTGKDKCFKCEKFFKSFPLCFGACSTFIYFEALHIKYWQTGGSCNPSSYIPVLWTIGILLHKTKFSILLYCIFWFILSFLQVCGTARHGLVRLWDMRHAQPVQMYYVKHPHSGQSSPVYSVAFDQSNLYVALDQCLSLVSFVNPTCTSRKTNYYNNKVVYYRWKKNRQNHVFYRFLLKTNVLWY